MTTRAVQICIVGPNGAGKSTLMNLVAGDLDPTQGEARRSIKLRVGRYAQHFVDALEMDDTPVEYLLRTWGHMRKDDDTELKEYDVRAMLGKFGLAGHHHHQARPPELSLFVLAIRKVSMRTVFRAGSASIPITWLRGLCTARVAAMASPSFLPLQLELFKTAKPV